ncbi:MAG: chromosome segregation protein SMC [Alphaproteobacteria bacterium]
MQFTRLRLSNFKSFADTVELAIEPGVTGIVGPNGCGKSNLVEALRWVMGETSAKQMRGGEMEDVIFSGTASRPARNIAEVALVLDNSDRTAPAHFNDAVALEISRQIERGMGSAYRVNGNEVRARDVQILFADQATGARSTALVSQGSVGALIAAKPQQRRLILEEAAGITGLYGRRHEAELKLRAAEANLARVDDVLTALEAQLQQLKKQARQANRYRNLSDHIRRAEATVLLIRWTEAEQARAAADEALRQAEVRVGEATMAVTHQTAVQTDAAAALAPLRQAEAEAAAALQRLNLERQSLEAEEQRIAQAERDTALRLGQIESDIAREETRTADTAQALNALAEEETDIVAKQAGEAEQQADAAVRMAAVAKTVEDLDAEVAQLVELLASTEARRAAIRRSVDEATRRIERIAREQDNIGRSLAMLDAEIIPPDAISAAEDAVSMARAGADNARAALDAADADQARRAQSETQTRDRLQALQVDATKLRAEENALADLLAERESDLWPPIMDRLAVARGFETALAAALGDDLAGSAEESAPIHWRNLPPLDPAPRPLPDGVRPLAEVVQGPDALARRLAQVGLVANSETGQRLQPALAAGQRLVTADGALWRWDGFARAAGAASAAATRLKQKNRLAELRPLREAADARLEAARAEHGAARASLDASADAARAAREALRAADAAFAAARDRHADIQRRAVAAEGRRASLREQADRLAADRAEVETRLAETATLEAELPNVANERPRLESLRLALNERRAALTDARRAHDALLREAEARVQRLTAIGVDRAAWRERASEAERQRAELTARRQTLDEELAQLRRRPAEIALVREALFERLGEAETTRQAAADRLTESERLAEEAGRALRSAEAVLSEARETRIRAEGTVLQAQQAVDAVSERVAALECEPQALRDIAEIPPGAALPVRDDADRRLDRLLRERDGMGPVNLRAEQEASELEKQMDAMRSEREELLTAIAKLRGAIGSLNREGRQRLLAAYEAVDKHFQDLFVRLFGGGRAHLTLTESDDPLEAGLEIMAQPPGKRLQTLTLLSGGERALTALALLFAVFMTNPAPICVLDEVDAPLDDANVDRFCTLVSELAHSLATRFLIVTHHRMTMARMDRLFGVTMAERGISQLVSVDLRGAERLRESA